MQTTKARRQETEARPQTKKRKLAGKHLADFKNITFNEDACTSSNFTFFLTFYCSVAF